MKTKDYGEPLRFEVEEVEYCVNGEDTERGERILLFDRDEQEVFFDSEYLLPRTLACLNAFADLDPKRSVVIDIDDAEELLSYLADGGPGCGVNTCPAAIRLRAAIIRKREE